MAVFYLKTQITQIKTIKKKFVLIREIRVENKKINFVPPYIS
jgi:hypothetical protein